MPQLDKIVFFYEFVIFFFIIFFLYLFFVIFFFPTILSIIKLRNFQINKRKLFLKMEVLFGFSIFFDFYELFFSACRFFFYFISKFLDDLYMFMDYLNFDSFYLRTCLDFLFFFYFRYFFFRSQLTEFSKVYLLI